MNPTIRAQFKLFGSLLLQEAVAEIEKYPDQRALMEECIAAGRDVRIVWHTKTKDISVEITNLDGTISELLRDHVIPDDGFAAPQSTRVQ
jgi:hypothetical protein